MNLTKIINSEIVLLGEQGLITSEMSLLKTDTFSEKNVSYLARNYENIR
jgi:hypothetical protein